MLRRARNGELTPRWRGSAIHRAIKTSIQTLFARFGYRLSRVEQLQPIDVRGDSADPRLFCYYGGRRRILMDVDIDRGIGFDVFPLADTSLHPAACAARKAIESTHPREAIRDTLVDYYRSVQPGSAAQWLGFSPGSMRQLAGQPPWARVLPWQPQDIRSRRNRVKALSPIESQNGGRRLTIEDGWKTYGPVSDRLLEVEVQRLHSLLDSIRQHGYLRSDEECGDINAAVLWKDENNWKWRITGGDHRAAVLSALGYEQIPVRLTRLVRRSDVGIWPNVTSGVYDEQSALELFDRLLEGALPPVVDDWANRGRKESTEDNRAPVPQHRN